MLSHPSQWPVLLLKICCVAILVICVRGVIWLVNMLSIRPLFDPLRHLPGPRGSLFESHLRQVMDPAYSTGTHDDWRKRFGQTIRFHGFGKHDYRLLSFDFSVVNHVMYSAIYEKPWQTRSFLGRLIGKGIFSVEGSEHAMQTRVIAPAFKPPRIKNMTSVFFRKAEELRHRWKGLLAQQSPHDYLDSTIAMSSNPPASIIDISHWISRAAFDVIGLAGFSYNFHSIEDQSEPVYAAYRRMFDIADKGLGIREILELYFPILRKIWVNDDTKTTTESLKVISRAGKAIIAQKKARILDSKTSNDEKDLLTLLIKQNLSTDPSTRLNDQELLDQCSTFLLAGSDTVSVALSWCFHLLARHPEIQARLREELSSVQSDDNLSDSSADSGFYDCTSCKPRTFLTSHACECSPQHRWDTLESLPYLDAVVRETLRFCPPVHATIRVAKEDDAIPTSQSITLSNGSTVNCFKILKGSYVHIPIEGLSFSEDIWGKDALEFNPNRWRDTHFQDPTKQGVYNLMTFGLGPHSCLGHWFAIAEMKIFIATLLPRFEFSPVEGIQISKFNTILTRPFVSGKWGAGTQLPLVVREVK